MSVTTKETGPESELSITMRQRADYDRCRAVSEDRRARVLDGHCPEFVSFYETLQAGLPSVPDVARPHQHKKLTSLYEGIAETDLGELCEGTGFGVISPTGSGKTVMIAMATKAFTDAGLKVLILSPRKKISQQIIGDDRRGFSAFAPELVVGEYNGDRKQTTDQVTVMMYQSLRGAVCGGDLEKMDPDVIICDEMHLAVQGYWGEVVRNLQAGRISVGFTATPGNPDSLNTTYTFPRTVASTRLRQGIEQGMLSDMEVYTYKGTKPVRVRKVRGEYDPEELAERFLNADENYLAAKIVAEEVASGKSGLVKCTEGMDRMHAKIMHAILSQTDVPNQDRKLRVAYIDGEMRPETLDDIYERKDRGEIDVLVSVNMFSLGYDGLREEFLVVIPPTMSFVGLEQLIGRVLRPSEGKVARVHQFVYDTHDLPQVLVHQILGREGIEQGVSVRNGEFKHYAAKVKPYGGPLVELGSFQPSDEEIRRKIAGLNGRAVEEFSVKSSQRFLPFDWRRTSVLAKMFGTDESTIIELLSTMPIEPRTEVLDDTEIAYYPPQTELLIAEKLGTVLYDHDTHITFSELYEQTKEASHRYVGRTALRQMLLDQGFTASPVVGTRGIVSVYDRDVVTKKLYIGTEPTDTRSLRPLKEKRKDAKKPETEATETIDIVVRGAIAKLSSILVHPDNYAGSKQRLMEQMHKLQSLITHYKRPQTNKEIPKPFAEATEGVLGEFGDKLNPYIAQVAGKQGLSVHQLILIATRL